MPKLLQPLLAAAITCSLATPALANPYVHGFRHMSQMTAQQPETPPPAPEVQPVPAPGPAPIAQPYPAQPYPAQPQPQQQPYYGPQPYPPQPAPAPYPPPRSRRKGMMVGGWTMLGASYLFTAVTGAIIADVCDNDQPCDRVGYFMLIPVAGPFIAIGPSQTASGSIFLGLSGVVQTAGLIMGIVGTAQFVADGRQQQMVLNNDGVRLTRNLRMNVNSAPRAAGAVLGLHYRF
jgi:hypothetical protein